jgi:heme exporter protein CcmD
MAQFFAMGGYAAFVWPAYGVTFAGLGGAIFMTLRAYVRAKSLIAELDDSDTR